jgi:hypothetical protein
MEVMHLVTRRDDEKLAALTWTRLLRRGRFVANPKLGPRARMHERTVSEE